MNNRFDRQQPFANYSPTLAARRPPETAKSFGVSPAVLVPGVSKISAVCGISSRGSPIAPALKTARNGSALRRAGTSRRSAGATIDPSEIQAGINAAVVVPLIAPQAALQGFMMPIKVDADFEAPLKQVVDSSCGEGVRILRVQPVVRSHSVKIWLAMTGPAIELVMTAVMRALPAAEFGQITPV